MEGQKTADGRRIDCFFLPTTISFHRAFTSRRERFVRFPPAEEKAFIFSTLLISTFSFHRTAWKESQELVQRFNFHNKTKKVFKKVDVIIV